MDFTSQTLYCTCVIDVTAKLPELLNVIEIRLIFVDLFKIYMFPGKCLT